MSDATESRPQTPFPAEGGPPVPAVVPVDPLAGDWSEGLRGPVRALGIAAPRLLALDGLAQPAPLQSYLPTAIPIAPVAEEVEAPDAWGAATEDPLQSAPPSEPPSVIITFTDPPASAPPPPAFPETTPPSPAPAFFADVTPSSPAPAFLPDVTPSSPAPAFLPDVTPATPSPALPGLQDEGVVELRAEDAAEAATAPAREETARVSDSQAWSSAVASAPAGGSAPTPWSDAVAAQAQPAAEPWKSAPLALPQTATASAGAWDQVTAVNVQAPVMAPPPDPAWQMPPPSVPPPAEPAEDHAWSAVPAAEPVQEWTAEPPAGDWEAVRKSEPPPVLPEAHAASAWSTLSSGPDWSAPPVEAPADDAWGSAPPPVSEPIWDAAPPAPEASTWDAAPPPPAAVQADWSAPPPPAARSWSAAPMGASALEQLDSEPPEPVPGAAKDLFGSVPAGASLAGDDDEQPPEDLGPPEELASPEEFLKPVDPDDADLLVPVDEEKPPVRLTPALQPLAMMQPVGVGPLFVPGEHRVAVHTRGGRTRRGTVKDVDLAKSQFSLVPQGGGAAEPVYHAEVKAIFFMLAPAEKSTPADGGKVRVTFADGRTIEGSRDGAEAKHGFFLVPTDAARTNTRRIYVAREATTDIKNR